VRPRAPSAWDALGGAHRDAMEDAPRPEVRHPPWVDAAEKLADRELAALGSDDPEQDGLRRRLAPPAELEAASDESELCKLGAVRFAGRSCAGPAVAAHSDALQLEPWAAYSTKLLEKRQPEFAWPASVPLAALLPSAVQTVTT
jgi:hypothetical protein